MSSYLERIEQTASSEQWPLVRTWMDEEPLALYRELREHRPVLELPEVTLVTRFRDCISVLDRHDIFSVRLYKEKQGDYWMAEDDTPRHWREKSIMRSILDLEELPEIRNFVAARAATLLREAGGTIEAVNGLARAVPIALVQQQFGFDESDPRKLFEWSYWNQYDAFHNQPYDSILVDDPEQVVRNRQAANEELRTYLAELVQRRATQLQAGGTDNRDPVTRLIKLSLSGAVDFDMQRVGRNVGGLLIGAVETTSHATINALEWLLEKEDVHSAAACAAKVGPSEFDGYVFEALRFNPAFPYFARVCESPVTLAAGTDYAQKIRPGTTVLAVTHSAMFDATAFPNPEAFDVNRSESNAFHFGRGLHECLGRHIGRQMIPEIVRQVLLLPEIEAASPVDKRGGPVPEAYPLRWDAKSCG